MWSSLFIICGNVFYCDPALWTQMWLDLTGVSNLRGKGKHPLYQQGLTSLKGSLKSLGPYPKDCT